MTMQQRSVIERIEILERKVETLEVLPGRVTAVELQLVQLRDEMRAEFSATRAEIRAGDEETRRSLRDDIRAGDDETRRTLRDEIRAGDEETRRVLRAEIDETRRYMRVLHDDVISRLAAIQEGRSPREKRQQ
jgi:hypothetical protein